MQLMGSLSRRGYRAIMALSLVAAVAAPLALDAQGASVSGGTLDRIRAAGRIRIGYRSDARPFAYTDESGQPAGYSVALCGRIADALKTEPGLGGVTVTFVPVAADERLAALQRGQIDLLCGAESVTLSRRERISFSVPIFPGGVGALVRFDAPIRLRDALTGRDQAPHPTWRGATGLPVARVTAVQNTTAYTWMTDRIRDLQLVSQPLRVSTYEAGVQLLLDRKTDVFFGERAVLLDAALRRPTHDLLVIARQFTYEPLALACPRGDEDFRLLVDRTVSRFIRSAEFESTYAKYFGDIDESTLAFLRWNALPD